MKISSLNHYSNDLFYNNYNIYFLSKLLEKINAKNILYKCFYLWKVKLNEKKSKIKCKKKLFKYFLLSLAFINKKKKIIDNKIKIGMTMFIWYKNIFKIAKIKP